MKRPCLVMAAMLLGAPLAAQSIPLGEIVGKDRAIRDPLYGWSARYPQEWMVHGVTRWGERETTIFLGVPAVPNATSTLYYQSHASARPLPANAEAFLRDDARLQAQRRAQNGLADYTVDRDSLQFTTIGGHPALRYTARFSSGGRTFCECVVQVLSDRGVARFLLRVPLAQYEAVRSDYEAMTGTLLLP